MTNYYTYKDTGEIIGSGDAPESMLELQGDISKGIYVAAGEANWAEDYLVNGVITKKPPKPSKFHIFDYTIKQWVDPRTLAELREAKWEDIKQARTRAIEVPLETPYGIFDADASGREGIKDAVMLLQTLNSIGQPSTTNFTLHDNSVVQLNLAQIIEVGLLLGQRVENAHEHSRILREQIDAATKEQLELIKW